MKQKDINVSFGENNIIVFKRCIVILYHIVLKAISIHPTPELVSLLLGISNNETISYLLNVKYSKYELCLTLYLANMSNKNLRKFTKTYKTFKDFDYSSINHNDIDKLSVEQYSAIFRYLKHIEPFFDIDLTWYQKQYELLFRQ